MKKRKLNIDIPIDEVVSKKKKGDCSIKSDKIYYVPINEVLQKIAKKYKTSNKKTFTIDTSLVRVKKAGYVSDYYTGLEFKYLVCVVDKSLKFNFIESRKFVREEDPRDKNKIIYYIPLYFLMSLLSFSTDMNIYDIHDLNVFRYTGEIDIFRNLNLFSLSNDLFLTLFPNADKRNIKVIL